MKSQIVIIGKIEGLTKIKEAILEQEYSRFNQICQQVQECRNNDTEPQYKWFKDKKTYCSTVTNAFYLIKKPFVNLGEQPLYLRNDVSRLEERETKISKYWLKVPTKQRKQFWVAVNIPQYYQNKMEDFTFCDSQIVKKNNEWFAHITIKKDIDVMVKTEYKDILGIDLGSRRPASVVQLSDGLTRYYGKEIRRIRGHYFHLRKKLAQKKTKKTIKKMGQIEKRKVNDQLHKISRKIVNRAKETNSIIVLGNLKNIQKSGKRKKNNKNYKGKKFNRNLNTMPFAKLSNYIEYKANLVGIMVIKVNEAYTSQICSKCGQIGKRNKGLFRCKCGYEDNADRNGAINIAKRGLGEMSNLGASVIMPRTKEYANIPENSFKENHSQMTSKFY